MHLICVATDLVTICITGTKICFKSINAIQVVSLCINGYKICVDILTGENLSSIYLANVLVSSFIQLEGRG